MPYAALTPLPPPRPSIRPLRLPNLPRHYSTISSTDMFLLPSTPSTVIVPHTPRILSPPLKTPDVLAPSRLASMPHMSAQLFWINAASSTLGSLRGRSTAGIGTTVAVARGGAAAVVAWGSAVACGSTMAWSSVVLGAEVGVRRLLLGLMVWLAPG